MTIEELKECEMVSAVVSTGYLNSYTTHLYSSEGVTIETEEVPSLGKGFFSLKINCGLSNFRCFFNRYEMEKYDEKHITLRIFDKEILTLINILIK